MRPELSTIIERRIPARHPTTMTRYSIAILGDYSADFPPHPATDAAISHSSHSLGIQTMTVWVPTTEIDEHIFRNHGAVWIAPGSPYRDMSRTLEAIRYAREHEIPCLGTCGGFQHMVIEYARNVLGHKDAQHAEYNPYASELFIARLNCSLAGSDMNLRFSKASRVREIYASDAATESYYCDFGVNPCFAELLQSGPLQFSGADSAGEMRVLELPDHPYFVGTLFVPQMRSTSDNPHPLVTSFLQALRR